MNDEAKVYLAPNIRDQALSVIQARADQRRDRRLLVAFEVNAKKKLKLTNQRDKDVEKFAKLIASMEKRLDQVRDLLDKVDSDLDAATRLHNAATLLDGELG